MGRVPFKGTDPWKQLGDWCQQCLGRWRQDGQTVCAQCAATDLARNGHGRYDQVAWGIIVEQLHTQGLGG
jgi:hypothetical protein